MYRLCIICVLFISCNQPTSNKKTVTTVKTPVVSKSTQPISVNAVYDSLFKKQPKYIANGFDYPVGKPNARGYYNAQKFTENGHLGDDWNGTGGGNSDLGDPIYSIGNGYVSFAEDLEGGWGNVVRIIHKYNDTYYESLYAHCDSMYVKKGSFVTKGTQIGTIGNVNDIYYAHLHFEIRDSIGMDIGGGYGTETKGYLDPTAFIKANRK